VIDPDTNTWYLTIKTYADQKDVVKGRLNGRYFVYAVDVNTLADKPHYPIPLEGLIARNNDRRMFLSGNQHQRPALLQVGSYIYAGFASHCVMYNYTGFIIGWEKSTGNIVEIFTTEEGPEPNTVRGGGIWMSGGGLTSDDSGSMWFGSGNGFASQLHGTPVPGRQPPSSLEEAAVHMKINGDGTLKVIDFFIPWEKEQLDGADKGSDFFPTRNIHDLLTVLIQTWEQRRWNFSRVHLAVRILNAWASSPVNLGRHIFWTWTT
jgi:hypothetical protein